MKSETYTFSIDIDDEDANIEDHAVMQTVIDVLEKIHGISNADFLWSAQNRRHEPFSFGEKNVVKKY